MCRKYLYVYEGGRAKQEKNTTVDDAVDCWIATLKYKTPQTLATYARGGRRIKNCAVDLKIGEPGRRDSCRTGRVSG